MASNFNIYIYLYRSRTTDHGNNIIDMKVITYLLPFIIVAVSGEWMRKTKQNIETNDIINRFRELSITACFSRCKANSKCNRFAMDKDISMGKTAECVLLQNHEKQKYTKMQEDSSVVELFVYEVSVRYNFSDISLEYATRLVCFFQL